MTLVLVFGNYRNWGLKFRVSTGLKRYRSSEILFFWGGGQGFAEHRWEFREKSWNKLITMSKYRGNFCSSIGNTGVISVHYQLPRLVLVGSI